MQSEDDNLLGILLPASINRNVQTSSFLSWNNQAVETKQRFSFFFLGHPRVSFLPFRLWYREVSFFVTWSHLTEVVSTCTQICVVSPCFSLKTCSSRWASQFFAIQHTQLSVYTHVGPDIVLRSLGEIVLNIKLRSANLFPGGKCQEQKFVLPVRDMATRKTLRWSLGGILTVRGGGLRGESTVNLPSSVTLVVWRLILMNLVVNMKLLLTYLRNAQHRSSEYNR